MKLFFRIVIWTYLFFYKNTMKKIIIWLLGLGVTLGMTSWNIYIHEVWFDGTDERIVLYNSWTSYSWMVEIIWAKSSTIGITTSGFNDNTFLIVWDNENNQSTYSWNYYPNVWISLSDTKTREISLALSWIQSDIFSPTLELVTEKNGNKESINYKDLNISYPTVWSWGNQQKLKLWGLQIQKISPYDMEEESEYIEIIAYQKYIWIIQIYWLWQSSSKKAVSIDVWTWEVTRITDKQVWNSENIILNSISLTNKWEELYIEWQWWQIIDKVVYTWWVKWEVLEYSYHKWDTRIFVWKENEKTQEKDKTIRSFTKAENAITPNPSQNTSDMWDCWILIQNNKDFEIGNSVNFAATLNDKIIQNSQSNIICKREWIDVEEVNKCNPSGMIFVNQWEYEVSVHIKKDGLFCKEDLLLNIHKKEEKEDKNIEANNPKIDTVINSQNKNIPQKEFTEQALSYLSWQVVIESILPNPTWSDTDQEIIILKVVNADHVDIWWLFINNWKSKYALWTWEHISKDLYEFIWSFWLKNTNTCVTLQEDQGAIYDKICYEKAISGIWYWNKQNIKEIQERVLWEWEFTVLDTNNSKPNLQYLTWMITIEWILPNPEGKDTGFEEIRLGVHILYTWWMNWIYINNGKKKTLLIDGKWELDKSNQIVKKWDFSLYNSASCVRIENSIYIFDEFCYPKPINWVIYSKSNNIKDLSTTKWMSDIKLVNTDELVCVKHKDSIIDCIAPKSIKKLISLEKKHQKEKISTIEKTQKMKDKISLLNKQIKFHKETLFLSLNILRSNIEYNFYGSELERLLIFWKTQDESSINTITSVDSPLYASMGVFKLENDEINNFKSNLFRETLKIKSNIIKNLHVK